jgi:hypothetical protein
MNESANKRTHDMQRYVVDTRREFLTTAASGLGGMALGSLLSGDGVLAAEKLGTARQPHFPAKAKCCIFIFMAGAPSHLDLFDPKPKLNELAGQPLPASVTKNVRFAFINKDAKVVASPRKFTKHGESGMEFSDVVPHLATCADDLLMVRSMHTEQFNHHPGQLMMQCGRPTFGLPAMGSWLTYGLGSPSQNLPGYVVLNSGRGSSGGATLWTSGFLPSTHAGVLFREKGEPVLDLNNPAGMSPELHRESLNALRDINRARYDLVRDPEIASRISNYELAFRMQSAAPELIDLSSETQATLDLYGVDRKEPGGGGVGRQGETHKSFARNCLLARRMAERGVRFINIMYASWDHHNNVNKELPYNASVVDQPIAALIKDLKQRGMFEETMVVWGAEFGRTPLGQGNVSDTNNVGRDHHPYSYTMLLAGGGLKGGLTYGASDEIGWGVQSNPVGVNDLHATMLNQFGLDHLRLTHRFQGRDFRLTDVGGTLVKDWIA